MTVEIAISWEQAWSAPLTEANLWEMPMSEFGVARMNVTPVSGIKKKWIHEYPSMAHLLDDRAHLTPVFIDENGRVELRELEHPEDALYVFGRYSYSPAANEGREGLTVHIDTKKPGMMWPHQALSIVLYDRLCR